jgi:YbgC/YbaW family acyl-CoA thioester hydrolase
VGGGWLQVVREGVIKKFNTKIQVYWADCDAAGIVYYGNFFRYFEMAEEDLFAAQGRNRAHLFQELQMGTPRVEVSCRFRKPARLGDLLDVTLWVEKRTRSSLVFRIEMRRAGESDLVCEATSRIVATNGKIEVIALPQAVIDLLADYLPPVSMYSPSQALSS